MGIEEGTIWGCGAGVRIHRILAEAAEGLVRAVLDEGRVLDRVMAEAFKANAKWGKRDRGFVAESVWEVVRWRRALAFVADAEDVRAWLAVVWRRMELEVPEWWSWEGAAADDFRAREVALADQPRAIRESVPDWLDARGERELGEAWAGELAALNRRAAVFLRVNGRRNSVEEAEAWLKAEGVTTRRVPGVDGALEVDGLLPARLLNEGRVEIQDAGSQKIVPLVEAEPGMRVLDACAGAGGKTLALGDAMEARGELLAMDVAPRKLEELKRRVQRAGMNGVKVERWGAESLRRWRGWADRVLIDAPCSGLGTLRRQPDLKWRLDEPGLEKVRRTQRKLLDHYGELLRPGGKMVYATCSVLTSENEGQLAALRERDGRWRVEEELRVSPAATGWDGFFAARLSREGGG